MAGMLVGVEELDNMIRESAGVFNWEHLGEGRRACKGHSSQKQDSRTSLDDRGNQAGDKEETRV